MKRMEKQNLKFLIGRNFIQTPKNLLVIPDWDENLSVEMCIYYNTITIIIYHFQQDIGVEGQFSRILRNADLIKLFL